MTTEKAGSTPPRERTLRALIVDDTPDDVALVVRALQRSGYTLSHRHVETPDALREALAEPAWD
ncbi:MAG: hypothetical protein R3A52_29540, partial [Polyangiales bacterium]